MNLTICVLCGHSAPDHLASGCNEILEWFGDGYPDICDCERTEAEVMRQHVEPVSDQQHCPVCFMAAATTLTSPGWRCTYGHPRPMGGVNLGAGPMIRPHPNP